MKRRKVWLGLLALAMLWARPGVPMAAEYFYVNGARVNLHQLPLFSSPVVGTGQFNDRVQKLGESPQGWTKVRSLRDGAQGWLPTRYLAAQPTAGPPPAPVRAKKRPKRPVAPQKEPPPEEKAPEPVRPKPL